MEKCSAMFKLENSPDNIENELDSDLLEVDPAFNLESVTNLFYNNPSIIDCLVDSTSHQASFPVSPIGPPDRYPVKLNEQSKFVLQINSSDVKRKKYLYSHKLNRIYVDIETCFCIEFNWNQKMFMHSGPMYVRSTVVFSDMAQAQKRVEVCVQHFHTATSAGKPDVEAKNVLLSARSGTDGVYYCGVPDRPDSWLSVLVEFNKVSDEPCLHAYQFVCKNSCSTGINRRSIEIIFTLEDKSGVVYGRQTVGARVCACPNRDLSKDERGAPAASASAKKRRLDTTRGGHLPLLPALPVVDKHILETGLTMILRMTEQAAVDRSGDPQAADDCKKSITAFKKYLADMKQPPS